MPLICGSSLTVKRTVAVPSGPGWRGSESITHIGTSAGPVTAMGTDTGGGPGGGGREGGEPHPRHGTVGGAGHGEAHRRRRRAGRGGDVVLDRHRLPAA